MGDARSPWDWIFPLLSHFVPNSRSVLSEISPICGKIAIPVPFCPILSHPRFPAYSRMAGRPCRKPGMPRGAVGNSKNARIWYGGSTRLGERHVSSIYPNVIDLCACPFRPSERKETKGNFLRCQRRPRNIRPILSKSVQFEGFSPTPGLRRGDELWDV